MSCVLLLLLLLQVIVARESCSPVNQVARVVNKDTVNNTVEVCEGTWRSMCGENGWSCRTATVMCREILNVDDARAIASYYRTYTIPPDRKNAYYYDCRGTERYLSQCTKNSLNNNFGCRTSKYAVVACLPRLGCSQGAIRLVGGETNDTGRLELCYNDEWSSVLYTSISAGFGYNEAAIACTQLGYTEYPRLITTGLYDSFEPRTYSWITNITCSGHEQTMLDCKITNTTSNCTEYIFYDKIPKQIGLQCYRPTTQCSDGAVRLVGGRIEQEGRVEVCLKGVWGSMCHSQFNVTDASVLCNSLGYRGNRYILLYASQFGSGVGPLLRGFDCKGWELNMSECFNSALQYQDKYNAQCSTQNTVAIRCSDFCSDGDVRLVGGPNTTSGIVEFCRHDSLWGLIAGSRWTDNNAKVVCKQLGMEGDGAVAVSNASHLFSRPKKLIHLANVYCTGSESVISDCALLIPSSTAGIEMMNEAEVAAVKCQVPAPTQSLTGHTIRATSTPVIQYSSNYTQSPSAGVNTRLSIVPSHSSTAKARQYTTSRTRNLSGGSPSNVPAAKKRIM